MESSHKQPSTDNWSICTNNETAQEIKLESYNFLGNKIDYEVDKFELDSYQLSTSYFKAEVHTNYESENEINANGDEVINLESDEDNGDCINLLNSSGENHNASNVSMCPYLESVLSDHNYSSQEIFAASPNKPVPESEHQPTAEPIDYVNEMQALIATWMNDADSENKTIILNDLENEIKRIKSTMLDDSQEISPSPQIPSGYDPNVTDASDDIENDSCYIMSEGHSEPLEYRPNRGVSTEDENMSEQIDREAAKTIENLRVAVEELSSKVTQFSRSLTTDTIIGETVKTEMIDLTTSGHALIQSIKALSVILKVEEGDAQNSDDAQITTVDNDVPNNEKEIDDRVGDSVVNNVDKAVDDSVDKAVDDSVDKAVDDSVDKAVDDSVDKAVDDSVVKAVDDSVDKAVDDSVDKAVDDSVDKAVDDSVDKAVDDSVDKTVDESVDGNIKENEDKLVESIENSINENSRDIDVNDNADESIKHKIDEENDETVENLDGAEDKASKLNDKSKIRWLASSSEDVSSSDESISETMTVRRRKKRARTISTSDAGPLTKNSRKSNVLLDSSDDDRSEKSVRSPTGSEKLEISDEAALKDVDLTDYLIPSDAEENDGETFGDVDSQIEQRVDSELEEFFGFDGHTCDDDDIQSPFTQEPVAPISNTTTESEEPKSSEHIDDKEQSNDAVSTYVESQQWDLPDDAIVLNDNEITENNEILSPKKEIEDDIDDGSIDAGSVDAGSINAGSVDAGSVDAGSVDAVSIDAEVAKSDQENENEEEEEESGDDTDDEINRLIDFSTIPAKSRPAVNHAPVYKKRFASKPKPKEDILDIIKDTTSQDIESESSSEEELISEEQYVLQLAKQQCLKDSSDEADGADSDSVDNEGQSSIDELTDESNDSKLNRFLKKQMVNEMENDLNSEEKIEEEPAPNDHSIDAVADDVRSESELELESSGIFEPEIELHDGEKPASEKDQDSEADETKAQQKPPEERKKWKLDKIAFNKNLFNDLDDPEEKNSKANNSDNSDCEVLDISMFKTKNKTASDLDKIIQGQKKRDVPKTSKVADECISLSSDSDLEIDKGTLEDDSEDEKPTKSRPMLRNDQLAGETKEAQKEENDRLKRLEKKTERLTQIVESQTQKLSQSLDESDVILDFDTKRNCAISVHPDIVRNLKEHQIAGVKFMYDCCYGSVDSIDKHNGSGCILAHCMGLGKTLQLIALLHTLIRFPQLKTKKILVICPKSTIMNWADEIQNWLRSVKVKLKVLHFPDPSDISKKLQILREWHSFKADPDGRAGCMLIGYEAFRSLVFYTEKPKLELSQVEMDRIKKSVDEYLLTPGADLVVCDEGHVIKNRKSTTSRAVNKISSRRRIILTGTPIQNNLKEYYSMVNFIKPSFLGTEKEFANLYENPIKEGQHKDSNNGQIRIMKQRSYVLHKKLSKFVQRREAALLKTFLPEKYEYVLFIPMTELQNRLYQYFLDNNPLKEKYGGKSLIPDYTFLRKIWTHPKVLENAWKNAIAIRDKKAAARRRNMDSDEEPDDVLDNQVGKMSVENDWWRQFIEPQDLRSLLPSNKLRILFEILKLCEQNREKCLIFSAFVAVLDVVEYFMQQIHNKVPFSEGNDLGLDNFHGPWIRNSDYYRLDGKTSKGIRHAMIQSFNDPTNERVKCFLISAKAGGQGINLVGANRVILLDTSWNPSNDQQNIFRVFRLGQQKKCYIYRLLAMGTMEEKVYSRSVTKQAMSFRVVDEQQIDRHYSLAELAELYTLTIPDPAEQPTPVRPVDNILASLLRNFKNLVYKYHEHDSLLENNSAEDLNEQEKADAWDAYEKDVNMKNNFGNFNITADGMYNNPYGSIGMGLNMMNPYAYIPPNLPPNLMQSYLQRTYQSGVEQELLMMSQMYSFNQSGGSTGGYGPLSAMFNTASSGATNSLYNSSNANSNFYSKPSIPPITTSSPSSYSNIPSNVFNGINQLSSSSSSSAAAAAQSYLARYMPSYPSSSSPIASSFPFNLYNSSTAASTTSSAQSLATNQPGPNAIKNPLLSNLLPPSKDSFSIPTSVITKASKDVQRVINNTSMGPVSLSPTSMPSNVMNQTSQSNQKSTHSSHGASTTASKGSPLMVSRASPLSSARVSPLSSARGSPLSSARGSPSIVARSSPSVGAINTPTARNNQSVKVNVPSTSTSRSGSSEARSSTSINRTANDSSNGLTISRGPSLLKSSANQVQISQVPLSITLAGSRNSPEPNIIVKDVTAINRTVERKSATNAATSKPPTQPIKNFNMGIVYPKAPEKKSEFSQNEKLLKAAHNQMQQLNAAKQRISLPQASPSRTVNRPVMTSINRTNNAKSGTRTIETSNSTSSLASAAKSHMSPNLPTNEVTITPTKRLQKVSLPISAINTHKLTSSSTLTPTISQKQPIEINKLNNSAISVSRLPSSTSITRQTPIPISTVNTSKTVGGTQNPPKAIPKPLNRQGSIPTLKLISQPSNSVQIGNKGVGISRIANTTMPTNRNPITRVVTTNNGVPKVAIQRPQSNTAELNKVFTNPVPKLANFSSSTNETRKRKLEELIPKNTGVTLIKKSKPDNMSVQLKKISPQRPKDPSSSSTVEIVELD